MKKKCGINGKLNNFMTISANQYIFGRGVVLMVQFFNYDIYECKKTI